MVVKVKCQPESKLCNAELLQFNNYATLSKLVKSKSVIQYKTHIFNISIRGQFISHHLFLHNLLITLP